MNFIVCTYKFAFHNMHFTVCISQHSWSHLELFEASWSQFAPFQAIESHLEPFGTLWSALEPFTLDRCRAISSHLEPFWAIWSYLEPVEANNHHLEPFGTIQRHLVPFGDILSHWIHLHPLGSCGAIWSHLEASNIRHKDFRACMHNAQTTPLDSVTGWTGELWSRLMSSINKNKRQALFRAKQIFKVFKFLKKTIFCYWDFRVFWDFLMYFFGFLNFSCVIF